ncbi:MAG TPA: carboxypeptidase-like regulatory domain-containing protein [Pirellulales bacterium]|jgi:hypothetical protein|nr:carboxypeptidase-like regulatory domain-containing protein [Pirellulales bacterium]
MRTKKLSITVAGLALAMMVLGTPIQLIAATPVNYIHPKILDIALHGQNELHGQAVDTNGKAAVGTKISLSNPKQKAITETVTDEQGRFVFTNVKAGLTVLQIGDASTTVRTWAANTAPPSAHQAVLVDTTPTVRGQLTSRGWLTTAVVTAIVAGAVVGIYEAFKDEPSGSP